MKTTVSYLIGLNVALLSPVLGQNADHRADLSLPSGQEVPKVLVLWLLEARPVVRAKEKPSLLLGKTPRHFTDEGLLPQKGEIRASLIWDSATIVLLDTEDLPTEVQADYRSLIDLGWHRYYRVASVGFQPAPDHTTLHLCFGDEKSFVVATERVDARQDPEGLTQVTLILKEGNDRAGCRRGRGPDLGDSPFPTLYAPEGAQTGGAGWSHTKTRQQNSQSLSATLSPFELLLHYGAQMEAQRWLPEAPNDYGAVAFQSWSFEDETGVPWHGLLVVNGLPDGEDQRKAELTILKLGDR